MPATKFDKPVFPGAKLVSATVTVTNTSGLYSNTFTDERIATSMRAFQLEIEDPNVFNDKISITTADGSFTIACDEVAGETDVTVGFLKIADDPTAISSTEFTVLNNRIGDLSDLETTDQTSMVNAVNEVIGDVSDNSQAIANLKGAGSVTGNADNMVTTGIYRCVSGGITNIPTGYTDGTLIVSNNGDGNSTVQTFVSSDNETFRRVTWGYGTISWTGWQQLAKKSTSMPRYVNEELNYAGAAICSLMRSALGKSEFMFLVEEKGTTRFILTHCFYNGSNPPSHTQIANASLALGAANAGGTQVINGCASGNYGEMRWTAW